MMFALAALLAGFLHVMSGPDHLAAIAPYAVEGKAHAWRTGVRWGLGHAAGVVGVGLLALLLREALPLDSLSAGAERFVGIMLMGIGSWGLIRTFQLRSRREPRPPRDHRHESFAVGTVHGLAGSSHLFGVLPALAIPSRSAAAIYLLVFGLGTVAAMGTFSSLVGWVSARPHAAGATIQAALMAACSLAAIATGAFWLFSN